MGIVFNLQEQSFSKSACITNTTVHMTGANNFQFKLPTCHAHREIHGVGYNLFVCAYFSLTNMHTFQCSVKLIPRIQELEPCHKATIQTDILITVKEK